MEDTIKKLDELFIKMYNHSKVKLDSEDENQNIKLIYKENKGDGERAVVIYWQNNEIIDIRTNYSFENPDNKLPTKENIVKVLEYILKENIKEED